METWQLLRTAAPGRAAQRVGSVAAGSRGRGGVGSRASSPDASESGSGCSAPRDAQAMPRVLLHRAQAAPPARRGRSARAVPRATRSRFTVHSSAPSSGETRSVAGSSAPRLRVGERDARRSRRRSAHEEGRLLHVDLAAEVAELHDVLALVRAGSARCGRRRRAASRCGSVRLRASSAPSWCSTSPNGRSGGGPDGRGARAAPRRRRSGARDRERLRAAVGPHAERAREVVASSRARRARRSCRPRRGRPTSRSSARRSPRACAGRSRCRPGPSARRSSFQTRPRSRLTGRTRRRSC